MQRQEAIEAVSLARRGRESWLRLVETDRIASVDYARPLGDGAFCETLRAKLDGDKEVALRVVKSCSKREVLKELKQVVSDFVASLDPEEVRRAVRDVRPRAELCLKMGGGHFESLLKKYKRGTIEE